jgi:hypothetical protein
MEMFNPHVPLYRLVAYLGDKEVELRRRRWQRYLEFKGGAVSIAVPIVLFYRGQRKHAQRVAKQLRRYGYQICLKFERAALAAGGRPTGPAASATPATSSLD